MDNFTKTCLLLLTATTLVMLAATYIGQSSGGEMEGTDGIVEDTAASTANKEVIQLIPTIPEDLEPIGFTLAGVVGGFLSGFFWYDAFERRG